MSGGSQRTRLLICFEHALDAPGRDQHAPADTILVRLRHVADQELGACRFHANIAKVAEW